MSSVARGQISFSNVLIEQEKSTVMSTWVTINGDDTQTATSDGSYLQHRALGLQYASYGVSVDDLDDAYDDLKTFLAGAGLFDGTDSFGEVFDWDTYSSLLAAYYKEELAIQTAIDSSFVSRINDLFGTKQDASTIAYLINALNETTVVDNGLILTSLIQLGQRSGGVFNVLSGINGTINTELQDPTKSIAAWFGGPMIDHEADSSAQSYAKSLFRMDGSGYLAGGNIFWNAAGYGGIPGITWSREGGQDIVTIGANVRLESLSNDTVASLLNAVQDLSDLFELVQVGGTQDNPVYAVHVKNGRGFYSDSFVTAGCIGTSGGGGGGAVSQVYGSLSLGGSFSDSDLDNTFNAYTINKINTDLGARITALEGGSATSITTTGSGNVVTDVSKTNTVITVTKGITALTSHQTVTLESGTNNGTLKLTTAAGTTDNIAVKGLGSLAYKSSLVASDIPDLSGTYLPLSGGTMTGDITLNTKAVVMSKGASWSNSFRAIPFSANGSNARIAYYNDDSSKGLFYNPYSGNLKTGGFIKIGGTSAQFLKADGSVDSNTYATTSALGDYLPLAGGTMTGTITKSITSSSATALLNVNVGRAGGWNQRWANIYVGDDLKFTHGLYGNGTDTLYYGYIGCDSSQSGDNLRIYSDKVQFGSNLIYHAGNLSLATLAGSSSIGTSTQPVYYNGSALSACDLSTTYAPYDANGYVKLVAGTSEQTITSKVGTVTKGVVTLWRNSGDHASVLGFSNGTTETYLGGIGFRKRGNANLYRWDGTNWHMIYDESNLTLTKSLVTDALGGTPSSMWYNYNGSSGYWKIHIKSTASWFLAFSINLYSNYTSSVIRVSGYNYNTTKQWYNPRAFMVGSTATNSIDVTFGKDGDKDLWVVVPVSSYNGISITDVVYGNTGTGLSYDADAFEITKVSAIPETVVTTVTVYPPLSTYGGTISGNLDVTGTLDVTGATTLSSTLSAGATTLASLGVTGTATIGSTLGVTGAVTLSSTLSAGASTLASLGVTGAATIGTTLSVTGATTLGSTLTVTGNILPSANNTYDLGSTGASGKWWDNIYGDTLHAHNIGDSNEEIWCYGNFGDGSTAGEEWYIDANGNATIAGDLILSNENANKKFYLRSGGPYLEAVNIGTAQAPVWAIHSSVRFYSDSFITAGGIGSGGSGGGGIDISDVWQSLTNASDPVSPTSTTKISLDHIPVSLSGTTITFNDGIHTTQSINVATATDLSNYVNTLTSDSSTGNVVTAISKSGNTLTVTKGITALTSSSLDGYVNAITTGTGNYITGVSKSGKTLTFSYGTLPTTIALSNVTGADDLKAIEALTGTSGLLKKTAANTWALDTTSYATAASLGNYLPLTGGTLTGDVTMRDYIDGDIPTYSPATLHASHITSAGGFEVYQVDMTGGNQIFGDYGNNGLIFRGSGPYKQATPDTFYEIYHEGNLTKSVITGLLGSNTYAPYNADGYLPLSGGQMTGAITFLAGNSKTVGMQLTVAGGSVTNNMDIGWDWATGAGSGIALCSSTATGGAGAGGFDIYARSSTATANTKHLRGTAAGALSWEGSFTATSIIKSGGTSAQFLKADGSVDSNTYLTTSSAASTYVTALGTDGDALTWTKNSVVNSITVPYATKSAELLTSSELSDEEFVYEQTGTDLPVTSAVMKSIKGKSVVWNQAIKGLVANGSSTHSGDYLDYTFTATARYAGIRYTLGTSPYLANGFYVSGHKYLASVLIKTTSTLVYFGELNSTAVAPSSAHRMAASGSGKFERLAFIMTPSVSSSYYALMVNDTRSSDWDAVEVKSPMLFDLTLMFGAGNEPSTVAEFEAMFPLDYYDYDAGTLVNNAAKAIETTGRNQYKGKSIYVASASSWPAFSKETYTFVKAGTPYWLYHDALPVSTWRQEFKAYDLNGELITSGLFSVAPAGSPYYNANHASWIDGGNNSRTSFGFTFAKDCYIYLGFSNGNVTATTVLPDICLSFDDTSKNGTYTPYWKSTTNVNLNEFKVKDGQGNIITITGCLKSAGSVYDEIKDGKFIQRVGSVDMGTLTWYYGDNNGSWPLSLHFANIGSNASTVKKNKGITEKFVFGDANMSSMPDNTTHYEANTYIYIRSDSYTTAADFKASVSGVMLYYELATPAEFELVYPIYDLLRVDPDGTIRRLPEDTASSVIAPFRAAFQYGSNIQDVVASINGAEVASARKLATPVTIWGQSFDGSGNVSGAFSGATTGAFSSNVTIGGTLGVAGLSTLSGGIAIGTTTNAQSDTLVWDETNRAWHLQGNFYADGFITAGRLGNGGGGGITIDDALSPTSENPVQNKVIYATIGDVESLLAAI